VGKWKAVRNTFVIFLVSGFWHGANWTFVAWGFIHALLFLPLLLLGTNRKHMGDSDHRRWFPSAQELGRMSLTFLLVTVAWVFFRAPSIEFALQYLTNCTIIPREWLGLNTLVPPLLLRSELAYFLFSIAAMMVIEWMMDRTQPSDWFGFNWLPGQIVIGIVAILHSPGLTAEQAFIYFQF
jgi:D-alanyl-lipoteichoic acid acyltransferase DltB (MBOAT superfamily)